ncbi:MAG: hypothetical protein P4L40_16925, partial [Terracidiphilus sp.]|nr:hypothetical protein [Terracidiphilus sp.]
MCVRLVNVGKQAPVLYAREIRCVCLHVYSCGFVCVCVPAVAGILYMVSSSLLVHFRIDDALDAFPVHGVGGFWGVVAAGLFSKQRYVADLVPDGIAVDYGVFYGV